MINEILFAGALLFLPPAQHDSLGIETVNGKTFVIHRVEEKETLYALSRRYGASVDEIVASNPGSTGTLEIGQIVKVPYTPKNTVPKPANALVHKVQPKETMFSISKLYGVSLEEIKQWNNLSSDVLSIGQELYIHKKNTGAVEATATGTQHSVPENGMHTVASRETLYSIARQYGVSVQQIQEWNKFENNELRIGQVIYVADPKQKAQQNATVVQQTPAQTLPSGPPAGNADVKTETRKTAEPAEPEVKNDPAVAAKTTTPQSTSPQPQTIRISEGVKNGSEVVESGIGELIDGTEGNRKYLALHRTAPVGTILKVRNEMNNREVFVRVMGKLPETANNDKVIIKISKSAFDRLGAIDPRFRVEVTYYK